MIQQEWWQDMNGNDEDSVEYTLDEEIMNRFCIEIYKLPILQRTIILCCLRGEKIGDIARQLGISEYIVRDQKRQAYYYLRKHLDNGFCLVMALLFS